MGRGAAKKSEALQMQAADRYSKLATEQYAAAKPAQDLTGGYNTAIIKGGPEAYRVAAPEVNFMKRQFANANSQVRNMAAGGQKNRAFRDLALTQPGAIAGVFQRKVEEALARLQGIAQNNVGNTLQATGGVSNAGNQLGQLAAARGQAVSGAIGGIAGIAGMLAGGGFGSGTPKTTLSDYGQSIH